MLIFDRPHDDHVWITTPMSFSTASVVKLSVATGILYWRVKGAPPSQTNTKAPSQRMSDLRACVVFLVVRQHRSGVVSAEAEAPFLLKRSHLTERGPRRPTTTSGGQLCPATPAIPTIRRPRRRAPSASKCSPSTEAERRPSSPHTSSLGSKRTSAYASPTTSTSSPVRPRVGSSRSDSVPVCVRPRSSSTTPT